MRTVPQLHRSSRFGKYSVKFCNASIFLLARRRVGMKINHAGTEVLMSLSLRAGFAREESAFRWERQKADPSVAAATSWW